MDLSDEQVSESSENFIIPESEILKFAEEIYLPEPSKTRLFWNSSNAKIRVNKIKNHRRIVVDNTEPFFDIINFEKRGFIIISSDLRMMPILAHSEVGEIPMDDTKFPPAMTFLLENYIKAIHELRVASKIPEEKVLIAWSSASSGGWDCDLTPSAPDCQGGGSGGGGSTPTTATWGPYLNTQWGQGDRYNDHLPWAGCNSYTNNRYPTGCVATATAQIMRYWSFPSNAYSWSSMPNGPLYDYDNHEHDLASLMDNLGDKLNMDYGCDGSSANTSKVRNVLVNDFGYSSNANYKNYNGTEAKNDLKIRPIILRACQERIDHIFWVTYDGCHAWVADGYRTVNYGAYVNGEIHMNWGWNGRFNAWYYHYDWTPGANNYQYKEKMLIGIKP